MKHLTLLLCLACVQCGPVPAVAIELTDKGVRLTPQELQRMSECAAQRGCYIVTRAALDAMVAMTIKVTLEEVAKDVPVCKRDSI